MNKDIITKEIVTSLIKDISKHLLGVDLDNVKLVDKELLRVEDRRADIVAEIDNSYILHIELQNGNDQKMALRMLRYFCDIKFATGNM